MPRDFILAKVNTPVSAEPVAANAVITRQEAGRLTEIDERIQTYIKEVVETNEVITRRLTLYDQLLVESDGTGEVLIGAGAIKAVHMDATTAVITESIQVGNSLITTDHIDVPSLSAVSADMGTVTAGIINLISSVDDTGTYMDYQQIKAMKAGVVYLDMNVDTETFLFRGEVLASRITIIPGVGTDNEIDFGVDIFVRGDVVLHDTATSGYIRFDGRAADGDPALRRMGYDSVLDAIFILNENSTGEVIMQVGSATAYADNYVQVQHDKIVLNPIGSGKVQLPQGQLAFGSGDTRYLYLSGNDIYWYDGSTGVKLN